MSSSTTKSPYLTASEAAEYLRVSESQLKKWRVNGGGPSYRQPAGPGTRVLYLESDLRDWVEGRASETDLHEAAAQQQ